MNNWKTCDLLQINRALARKYRAMGLPVQRRNAVEWALFYRKVLRNC